MTATPSAFPWSSLPSLRRAQVAATHEALRALAPSPPRPDLSLPPRWRALLGGELLAAPGVPALTSLPTALPREVFTAVFERDDAAVLLALLPRSLARAAATRALSLPDVDPDAPITAAEEGALMALCAKLSALACAPGPPHRIRAVTDDPDDALHALRDGCPSGRALLRWDWAVRTVDGAGALTLLFPARAAPPWPFAPRPSVLGAAVRLALVAARARWPARDVASIAVDDLFALEGLRLHRGAPCGGVDIATLAPGGPVFSGTLTPLGARIDAPAALPGGHAMPVHDPPPEGPAVDAATLHALPVELTVELAQRECAVGEVASWRVGAVVEFPSAVGAPALLRAGGRPIARGALVEVEGNVGLRITELL